MIDTQLRRLIDPMLDPVGAALARRGIAADHVTLVGLGLGIGAGLASAFGAFLTALALVIANRLCDGLDGAVAKASGRTEAGGFLDITCDFVFYGAVPVGFALHAPEIYGLPAAILLFSFYVNGSAFLAFATLAARHPGIAAMPRAKSFHYMWGLAEGAETILFLVAVTLMPQLFPVLAVIFAMACLISGAARMVTGYRAARALRL
ncbi:MAG: CDP-alcohol phosphatidyltransferase family protein [Phreatobacter sp.]